MRSVDAFNKVMTSIEFSINASGKGMWVVPTDEGYRVSCFKPNPRDLPQFTCAVQYSLDDNSNLFEVDSVSASD